MGQLESNSKSSNPDADDPQTHYIHDKAESHFDNAGVDIKLPDPIPEYEGILDNLGNFATKEKDAVRKVIDEIKTEIIEPFRTLTLTDIIKKLAAIIGKVVIETAKSVLNLTLDILKDISRGIIEGLNKPLSIPILSKLYRSIANEDLSILDLICLAAAVPSTLIYKAVTGSNPFPDDSITTSLIKAADYSAVQSILNADSFLIRKFAILSEFIAMAGLFLDIICSTLKLPQINKGKPHKVPEKLKQVSIGVKLLIVMPSYIRRRDPSDAWYWKFDYVMTDLAILKTV